MKSFLIALSLMLSTSAFGQSASTPSDTGMIQIGAGALQLEDQPIEALFRIEGYWLNGTAADISQFVVARISSDTSVGEGGFSFVDLQFNAIGLQFNAPHGFVSAEFLNLNLQRNVALGNDYFIRLTLVGLRGQGEFHASESARFLLSGALDVFGVAVNERAWDRSRATSSLDKGATFGASGVIGFAYAEHFRILLGQKWGYMGTDAHWVEHPWYECRDRYYNDPYHYDHQGYYGCGGYSLHESRWYSTTHLSLMASLSQNLSVFGEAAFQVYSVSHLTDKTHESQDSGWIFRFGASYTPRSN